MPRRKAADAPNLNTEYLHGCVLTVPGWVLLVAGFEEGGMRVRFEIVQGVAPEALDPVACFVYSVWLTNQASTNCDIHNEGKFVIERRGSIGARVAIVRGIVPRVG